MIKKFLCLCLALFSLFGVTSYTNVAHAETKDSIIYLGGQAVGFSISTQGAYIVGLSDVITSEGIKSPAKEAGIEPGDILLSINDEQVNNAKDIEIVLKNENEIIVGLKRQGQLIFKTMKPIKDVYNKIKLGVYIKEDMSGIGTVTFIRGSRFASLGHPILDEMDNIMEISGGNIYNCNITGFIKGERGKPGELRGVINKKEKIGSVEKNLICGVFGDIEQNKIDKTNLKAIEVGEAKMGNATIFSTIDGNTPKEYSINIVKVEDGENKNFVVKITDEKLLETTGGIIQGMSGSPVVQNGKLVGAVTHVFINDPTRGFGISIQNMINN